MDTDGSFRDLPSHPPQQNRGSPIRRVALGQACDQIIPGHPLGKAVERLIRIEHSGQIIAEDTVLTAGFAGDGHDDPVLPELRMDPAESGGVSRGQSVEQSVKMLGDGVVQGQRQRHKTL
jgi:hypothetical protein